MSFDNDSSYSEIWRVVEKDRDNLINSRSDHRAEIASFLKLQYHNVNKIKKLDFLNIDLYFIKFLINLSDLIN